MAIASSRLGTLTINAAGATTIYTVPTGKRTIVKRLVARNGNALATAVIFRFNRLAGQMVSYRVALAATNAAGDSVAVDFWLVLHEGEWISVDAGLFPVQVYVSGAELEL